MITWKMILTTGRSNIKSSFPGFSLLELVIVVGIVLSVTSLSSLLFKGHFAETVLKTSAQDIASTLNWARRLAITRRKLYKVVFRVKEKKFWIEDDFREMVGRPAYLHSGVIFANPGLHKWGEEDGLVEAGGGDSAFSFYPQGTAEGGSIYIKEENSNNWYTITIVPSTGRVNVYPGKH